MSNAWDLFFNFLLLLFWFRIWSNADRDQHFNPYVAQITKSSRTVIGFLKPAFFGISERAISVMSILFLVGFRALLAYATPENGEWILRIGFERWAMESSAFASALAFSVASFGIFLFKLWGLSLIYVHTSHGATGHTRKAVYYLARPFSDIRVETRPLFLIGWGALLLLLMASMGDIPSHAILPVSARQNAALPARAMQMVISSIAGWADVLPILITLVIVFIIGSLVSAFTASHSLMFLCRDWLDLFLGPLRRFPLRIGMFDLTPLIFIFGIQWVVYPILIGFLWIGYAAFL